MLIPDDKSAAKKNTAALAEDRLIMLPAGAHTFYFEGTATTKPLVGCGRIMNFAALSLGGYPSDHPNFGTGIRFIQLGKGPILRLAGTGFVCEDPIEWVGDGESAAIEIEGRANPPTGHHRFRNQIFANCGAWFKTLPGYYNGRDFVSDESHADMSIVENCEGYNCDRVFWSQNQQSSGWKFRDCSVNVLGTKSCVVYDCERGGGVQFTGTWLNHPRVTLVRIKDYSPHQCKIIFRDFFRDVPSTPDNWLTLIDHTGSHCYDFCKWDIEITGFAPGCSEKDFYKVPAELPRSRWKVEVGK